MTDSATINVSSKPREGRPPQEASISEEEWTETRTRTDLYIVVGGDAANLSWLTIMDLRRARRADVRVLGFRSANVRTNPGPKSGAVWRTSGR
jgi:hypothetical protein